MKDFVTIYQYRIIFPSTPFSVHLYNDNQCMHYREFATLAEARAHAATFNLPISEDLIPEAAVISASAEETQQADFVRQEQA